MGNYVCYCGTKAEPPFSQSNIGFVLSGEGGGGPNVKKTALKSKAKQEERRSVMGRREELRGCRAATQEDSIKGFFFMSPHD